MNVIVEAVFESKLRSNVEETKLSLIETLDSLKGNRLHPLYVLLYESLQNAKLNKQVSQHCSPGIGFNVSDVSKDIPPIFLVILSSDGCHAEELFPELNEVDRR